jgi:hypothetical protein
MSIGSFLSADLSRVLEEFGFHEGPSVEDDVDDDDEDDVAGTPDSSGRSTTIFDAVFDGKTNVWMKSWSFCALGGLFTPSFTPTGEHFLMYTGIKGRTEGLHPS